jgi:LPS-assembly protein
LERTFKVPETYRWLLGDEVRHTIEPEFTYRDVKGVSNFLSLLRFDDNDLESDTNELQYGVTQHLYFRPREKTTPEKSKARAKPCVATMSRGEAAIPGTASPVRDEDEGLQNPAAASSIDANGIPNASTDVPDEPTRTHDKHAAACTPTPTPQQEWFSWRLTQKYFFDGTFGGAVITNRRNIFDTTLQLSGIAFLTEARNISPLISRMRLRTSSHTDLEWDFDYDTGATKFNSQNVLMDAHEGNMFGGFSFARLNAPGRNQTLNITTDTRSGSATSNYSQMRVLIGYGAPSKPGLAVAASAGLDLNAGAGQDQSGVAQYITIQGSYNWNCCGLSVEYRKYDLGSVRNEGTYSFNFTLANIGTAGNLRRAQALF